MEIVKFKGRDFFYLDFIEFFFCEISAQSPESAGENSTLNQNTAVDVAIQACVFPAETTERMRKEFYSTKSLRCFLMKKNYCHECTTG